MLVIITDEQLLSPKQVCQTCLMANRGGLPRWHQGKLKCGRTVNKSPLHRLLTNGAYKLLNSIQETAPPVPAVTGVPRSSENQAEVYECQMGFRVADI